MNVKLLIAAGLCLAVALPASLSAQDVPADAAEAPLLNADTTSFDIDSLEVVFKATPGNPIATVVVYFDGGTLFSSLETAGYTSLALNVAMNGGPETMTKSQFQATLDIIGSSFGASAGFDYDAVSLSCISSEFEQTWDLFVETLNSPAMSAEEIELRRTDQLTAIATMLDDPDNAARETARGLIYSGHPYRFRPSGLQTSLEAATAESLRSAYDALFVRERMLVVVVGDLTQEQVEQSVRDAFASVPSNPDFALPEVPPLFTPEPRVNVLEREGIPTNYILGYFAAPDSTHEDYPAFQIATEILSDRLFEEVRTARNLSYAVSAGLGTRRANNGAIYVTATEPETTLGVMYDTVDAMIETPVSDNDLRDQIEGYLTRYYMTLQSTGAQASMLGQWELLGGGREAADGFVEQLRQVSGEDVARVLETYVRNVQFGIVGTPEQIPEDVFTSR